MTNATRDLLEQHFDTAFSAPDGIAKMRELILTLAMQGTLVEQDPADQPASALLKDIDAEKQRLVKAGKIKAPKPLPPIKPEEVPYQLPQGWEWVRLGEIGIINPRNDADDLAKAGFVPMPMIPQGYSEKHQFEERSWIEIKKGYTHFADGDIGMAKITPCFENGKSCVFSGLPNGIGAGTTELHIFRNSFNSVESRFLLWHLKNPHYIWKAAPKMTGSAGQKRVPTPYFTEQLFPLPPLSEQHRIVARIDQLMARCDARETLRKEREEKRLAVHAAAMQQLLAAPDSSAWGFIEQHFDELYSVKENVAELRKAILQLAVMGRLVPQDPNDPPASELLEEIESERLRLFKAGKIKTPKPLPPIKTEEVPYQLPQGWEWVRVAELTNVGTGSTPETTNQDFYGGSIPWYTSSATNDLFAPMPDKFITEKAISETNCKVFPAGSLMVAMYGQGKTRGQVSEIVIPGATNQAVAALVFFRSSEEIKKYLKYIFIKIYDEIRLLAEGAAQPNLNVGKIKETLVPLPPLSEQHRIVARIDQLMALCDTVDQKISDATDKQTELLRAVMAQV